MQETLITIAVAVLGGGAGAAVVTGIFACIKQRTERKYAKEDRAEAQQKKADTENDVQTKALRYIMLYIIQERCKEHIRNGEISLEDRRALRHWHDLYHNGLDGNGDATALMNAMEALPLSVE